MKHLQHFIVIIIFASLSSLRAMDERVLVFMDGTAKSNSELLVNPEKKPVFRIRINNDFEKEIIQYTVKKKGIQYLHNTMHNIGTLRQICPIVLKEKGMLTKTSAQIRIETVFNKQDCNDELTRRIFDYIYNSNKPNRNLLNNISYHFDEQQKNLYIQMFVFAELYEYLSESFPMIPLR